MANKRERERRVSRTSRLHTCHFRDSRETGVWGDCVPTQNAELTFVTGSPHRHHTLLVASESFPKVSNSRRYGRPSLLSPAARAERAASRANSSSEAVGEHAIPAVVPPATPSHRLTRGEPALRVAQEWKYAQHESRTHANNKGLDSCRRRLSRRGRRGSITPVAFLVALGQSHTRSLSRRHRSMRSRSVRGGWPQLANKLTCEQAAEQDYSSLDEQKSRV